MYSTFYMNKTFIKGIHENETEVTENYVSKINIKLHRYK